MFAICGTIAASTLTVDIDEQSEQPEQYEQREQSEQREQLVQSLQSTSDASAFCAASADPQYATEQRLPFSSLNHSCGVSVTAFLPAACGGLWDYISDQIGHSQAVKRIKMTKSVILSV